MKRAKYIIYLGLVVALAAEGTSPAGERGLVPVLIGGNNDLSTGVTTNLGGVSAAHNSTDNEYRVVWFDSRISGQNDVYAQRVSTAGALLGPNVTIIAGSNSQTDTAIAYNPMTNQYFVTWRNQSDGPGSEGFNHAFGGLVSATGGLIAREGDVSNGGLEATLAYNSTNNEYFLEARNFAGGGTAGIRGQRISSLGALVGGGITIATAGAPAPAGQVAYNANANQYLATWRDQSDANLKGRLINADGTLPGSPFVISSIFPGSGLSASVAFDPLNDRYLVVFGTFSGGPVIGQFVSGSGTPGASFTIFNSAANLSPFVAYDSLNQVFLVAWRDSSVAEVSAQLLADDGSPLGSPLSIVSGTAYNGPRVAANSNDGQFIVAWADNRNSTSGEHDCFAQVVGVTTGDPCIGDINDDGDVDFQDLDAFIAVLLGTPLHPDHVARSDLNGDGVADGLDVPDFITAMFTGC
jgi:hypothetical protein